MSQQTIYKAAKPNIEGHHIDVDGAYGAQCVDVDLYMAQKYFPGVHWTALIPPVPSARLLGSHHNDKYFEWIPNDHNNVNQLPQQGDFLVCDATPKAGYANKFTNEDGHTGVVDSCNTKTVTLLMQDGSNPGGKAFLQTVEWRYRPVLGWLRPRLQNPVARTVSKVVAAVKKAVKPAQTVSLPGYGTWTLYKEGSGLRKGTSDVKDTIQLSKTGALKLPVISWVNGKNAVKVNVPKYGVGVIWVAGTVAKIK